MAIPDAPKRTLKVRFATSWNGCNYHCEYCVIGQLDAPQTMKAHRRKQIARRLRNLIHPTQVVASLKHRLRRRTTRDADRGSTPAVWDQQAYDRIIDRFAELPYALDVRIGVGGETFVNRSVVDGARRLSHHDNTVAVNLITNLSFDYSRIQALLDGFDLSRVAVVASYHPTQIRDVRQWLDTAARLQTEVDLAVVLVAWPPLLSSLRATRQRLLDAGLDVFIQAFQGWHAGRKYPEAYSAAERRLLRELFYSPYDFDYMVELKKPGLCYAGVDYVYVDIRGDVYRCGTYQKLIGNVFDGFQLDRTPQPCPGDQCWCDTENLNTKEFRDHYRLVGLNQHKYVERAGMD